MGVSRQVLIRRKLLLPDHSRGKVEAGSRLKLEPNISYFQMHKSIPPHASLHNPCGLNSRKPLKCLPGAYFPASNSCVSLHTFHGALLQSSD